VGEVARRYPGRLGGQETADRSVRSGGAQDQARRGKDPADRASPESGIRADEFALDAPVTSAGGSPEPTGMCGWAGGALGCPGTSR
jgi:hypothetical protein